MVCLYRILGGVRGVWDLPKLGSQAVVDNHVGAENSTLILNIPSQLPLQNPEMYLFKKEQENKYYKLQSDFKN